MTLRILALDLATCSGFALGSTDEGVIEHGSHRLPKTGDDVGAYLMHFRTWLDPLMRRLEPDAVYFESPPLFSLKKTTPITVRKLNSLAGLTELIAHDHGVECREANVNDITTHFLGKSAPRFGDARKKATIARCEARGWTVMDDNDADALALLDYALALRSPERAIGATPLFGGARTAEGAA